MSDIVKINFEGEKPTISARELHKFLCVETPFAKWFGRMCEYGFSAKTDYAEVLDKIVHNSTGGRPATDYEISIDMAKELCMIQRNERGKQARQYFILIEKQWNSPEMIMARALKMADRQLTALKDENVHQKQVIAELKPKAAYCDIVLQTSDILPIVKIAKDFGKSAQWLNERLHQLGIQYKVGDTWLLYQQYADQGYTKSKTITYINNGIEHSKLHTCWTQAGRLFIYELLKSQGILPMIERDNVPKINTVTEVSNGKQQ